MTAAEQRDLGVIDLVVPEPGEGAHTDLAETARRLRVVILDQLDLLARRPIDDLVEARYQRFRAFGPFTEVETAPVGPAVRPGFADRIRNWFDWSGLPSLPPPGREEPPARDEV
jgi:hypothetical protein